MTDHFDIAIVGAGPAGGNAAVAAARAGLRIVLLDEWPASGGQVWRAKSPSIISAPETPESKAGDALRAALAECPATHLENTQVWDISRQNDIWTLEILRNQRSEQITAAALILATGAREFVQPVAGWTTPGVIGLAGATALFKQTLSLPGKRTVVSGTGPLVFYVASEVRRLGGEVVAIVTPNTRADWVRTVPAMMSQPKLLARGFLWMADLVAARVPILWGYAVSDISGNNCVTEVSTCHLDQKKVGPSFDADSLCLGHGLIPNIEAAQLLGVPIRHDPALGGWVPEAEPDGATCVKGLYLCGDGCGIRGVAAASLQGTLTGTRAARDMNPCTPAPLPSLAPWRRAARFGIAMTALSQPRADVQALTTEATIVCRCESLSLADISTEIDTGATSTNAVKSGRRAGMGPCGGKYCQTAIASLIAKQTGKSIAEVPPPTPRPPLRPMPLGQIVGEFEYDSLPIPSPAPL